MVDTRAGSERATDTASPRVRDPEVEAAAPVEAEGAVGRLLGGVLPGLGGTRAAAAGGAGAPGAPAPPVRRPSSGFRGGDLVHLQRLAGNSAVAGLVARSSRPSIRAAAAPSPVSQEPVKPEERAPDVNPKVAEAIQQWQAAPAEEVEGAQVERDDQAKAAGTAPAAPSGSSAGAASGAGGAQGAGAAGVTRGAAAGGAGGAAAQAASGTGGAAAGGTAPGLAAGPAAEGHGPRPAGPPTMGADSTLHWPGETPAPAAAPSAGAATSPASPTGSAAGAAAAGSGSAAASSAGVAQTGSGGSVAGPAAVPQGPRPEGPPTMGADGTLHWPGETAPAAGAASATARAASSTVWGASAGATATPAATPAPAATTGSGAAASAAGVPAAPAPHGPRPAGPPAMGADGTLHWPGESSTAAGPGTSAGSTAAPDAVPPRPTAPGATAGSAGAATGGLAGSASAQDGGAAPAGAGATSHGPRPEGAPTMGADGTLYWPGETAATPAASAGPTPGAPTSGGPGAAGAATAATGAAVAATGAASATASPPSSAAGPAASGTVGSDGAVRFGDDTIAATPPGTPAAANAPGAPNAPGAGAAATPPAAATTPPVAATPHGPRPEGAPAMGADGTLHWPGEAPAGTATGPAGPAGATGAGAGAAGTAAADPKAPGFPEKPRPRPKPKAGGTAPAGGKGGGGKGKAGGGGGAAAPVPLGDPTLERWRSAAKAGVDAVPKGDLGDAKEGPERLDAKGKEVDAARKGAQPDYAAEAKGKQPPMPKEPEKAQYLDTKEADAAVDAIAKAGDKRLATQTFKPVDFSTMPRADELTAADFVPRNLSNEIKDLEAKLAGKDLKPAEREAMTKLLEKRKAEVAKIEEHALDAPSATTPTVTDKGPAKLEPLDPGQADLLGDAVARMLGQVGEQSQAIVKKTIATMRGDKVPRLLDDAKVEEPTLRAEIEKELNGIATAAGLTEEQLKKKVEEQKDQVKKEKEAVEQKLAASSVAATKSVEDRGKDEGKQIAGAKKGIDAEIAKKQAAVDGPPDTAAIERKRDEFLGRAEQVGAQALAGIRASMETRGSDLDKASGDQKGQVKSAIDNRVAAIRRHYDKDPQEALLKSRPTADWGATAQGTVDREGRRLKGEAQKEADGITEAVKAQITTSKESIRDWAAHQQGTERSWWDRLMDMVRDWGKQATVNNEAWERQRNAQTRDAMVSDFNALTAMREAQVTGNGEAMNKEFARLSGDQRKLAQLYFSGGISGIEFVAQSTIGRITDRRVPELSKKLEEKAIASWDWEALGQLARGSNPKFNPSELANKVKGGVAGWGTNEAQVYAGLGGARTAVERAALDKCYLALFHVSMAEDVKDDMGGHEMERAQALMEGKSAEADAAAIKEAVAGLGTDEQAIRDALRGKTPEELDQIKAEYKRMYGTELKTDLSDDMEDAELDNALALADGDVDKADAAELEDAMAGPGTNEEKLQKVYERIRQEEEAKARKDGLSPAELKQRILARNARVKTKFGEKYGDLDAKLTDELLDGDRRPKPGEAPVDDGDLKVLDALQSGDPTKIDAAKAYREHKGVYASDDEIEKVVRNQSARAELDVGLDLASEKARLEALKASGDIDPKEADAKIAEITEKQKPEAMEKAVKARAQQNMGELKGEYSKATDGRQTFDMLVKYETSGASQDEIKELVKEGGKLEDAQELYYAVEGAGTDEDKIKEVLKGKTPKQIAAIKAKYAELHPGRTLEDDVLGDLSGREDLDVGHILKYGDPDTFAQQLEEEKDPVKRKELLAGMKQMLKERTQFEETGTIGAIFSLGADPMNTADQLAMAVDRAEKYDAALADAEAHKGTTDPDEKAKQAAALEAARANFEMNYGGTMEAQEQVRAQIDSYADAITQVGAAVAGLAVTIATLGAAGPVVAAMYGAAAAAAMTMALKANLKGAAYSWEEAGTDAAIGVVDATVSGLTAGLGKGVMQALEKAVASQVAKQVAKEGAEKVTESVVKVWAKEAMEEVIENAIQAMPSAFVGSLLDDNTWKSGDPWGTIWSATGQAGAMGAGMAVGIKGVKDVGGAAIGKIKGAKAEPKVHENAPKVEPKEPAPHAGGSTAEPAPPPHLDAPEPKPIDLPAEADPGHATAKAEKGEVPPEAHGKDVTKGGTLPESAGPDPKPGEPRAPEKLPEKEPGGRSTPVDEGATPKGSTASGDPHTAIDTAEITEFPEGSVGQLPETHPKDPAANKEFFEKWHESDPSREVALLRNTETGEFVVVQGGTGGVDLGRENPRWAEDLLTPEQRGKGNWVYEAHSHPIDASTRVTPEHARWPSGGGDGDDFHGLVKESARTGGPVKEEIRYVGEKGPETLSYGYDPKAEKPFFVERPGPDGNPVRHEYATIDEYHAAYEKEFGREPGRPIADDFQGAREPIDHEAPTLKPGELEAKGVGAGASDPSAAKPGDVDAKPVGEVKPEPAKKGGPSAEDVGRPLTPDDLKNRYGMPEANVKKISDVCAAEGIIVDVRPTTPHAEAMLREGTALPKPEKVKAKTINETDIQIGLGKEGDLGKVGFYDPAKVEPRRPADFDSLPKETQDRIDKRIKQRKEEFADFAKDMQKLQDAGLIRIEPDGTVINTGLIPGGEKPFTGDHDIFDIRAKDGSKLTPEQYQKAKAALLAADAGVMHGGVTGWEVDSPSTFNTEAGQKSYNKMVSEHSPGGDQPLVRLGDGEPKATWYEPAGPPRENVPGGRNTPASGGRSPAEEAELRQLIASQAADRASGDVGMVDLSPEDVKALDLPEYQEGVGRASDLFAGLPDIENPKNVAVGPDNVPELSGFGGGAREGAERVRAEGLAAGHEPEPHVFDPKDSPGLYESSHSERKRAAGTDDQAFASSKPMCPACQRWFAARAMERGMPMFVGDPTGVRVFLPNGGQVPVAHPSGAVTHD